MKINMINKYTITFIIVLIIVMYFINMFYINPMYVKSWTSVFDKKFDYLIAYKNEHRGNYLFLVSDSSEISKYKTLSVYEAFKKPDIGSSIKVILYCGLELYDFSKIGDKIIKNEEGNKCILVRGDSLFRYNCSIIPDKLIELYKGNIDEWPKDQIGFWKIDSVYEKK